MSAASSTRHFLTWLRTSLLTTTVLVVALIGEAIGMSWYTYLRVQRDTSPQSLAESVKQRIRNNYPELRTEIRNRLEENAPAIVQNAGDAAIRSGPAIRRALEKETTRQLEYGLDQATELSAEQFRQFVRDNRQTIKEMLLALKDAPDEARELAPQLEQRFENHFGVDLQTQSKAALRLHRGLNTKLERLGSQAHLEPKELIERRIVRILRALEMKYVPEVELPEVVESEPTD